MGKTNTRGIRTNPHDHHNREVGDKWHHGIDDAHAHARDIDHRLSANNVAKYTRRIGRGASASLGENRNLKRDTSK